jgi:hypothetical protein
MKMQYGSKAATDPANPLIWSMANSYDFRAIAFLNNFVAQNRNNPGMRELVQSLDALVKTRLKALEFVRGKPFSRY